MLVEAGAAFVTPELAEGVPAQLPALAVGGGFTARPDQPTALPAFPDAVLAMPDDLLDPGAAGDAPAWEQADQAWVLGAAEAVARRAGFGPGDVVLLEDLAGRWPVTGLVPAILAGATVVLSHAVADPDAVARAERVTFPSGALPEGPEWP